jgi:hypothetical protein
MVSDDEQEDDDMDGWDNGMMSVERGRGGSTVALCEAGNPAFVLSVFLHNRRSSVVYAKQCSGFEMVLIAIRIVGWMYPQEG